MPKNSRMDLFYDNFGEDIEQCIQKKLLKNIGI